MNRLFINLLFSFLLFFQLWNIEASNLTKGLSLLNLLPDPSKYSWDNLTKAEVISDLKENVNAGYTLEDMAGLKAIEIKEKLPGRLLAKYSTMPLFEDPKFQTALYYTSTCSSNYAKYLQTVIIDLFFASPLFSEDYQKRILAAFTGERIYFHCTNNSKVIVKTCGILTPTIACVNFLPQKTEVGRKEVHIFIWSAPVAFVKAQPLATHEFFHVLGERHSQNNYDPAYKLQKFLSPEIFAASEVNIQSLIESPMFNSDFIQYLKAQDSATLDELANSIIKVDDDIQFSLNKYLTRLTARLAFVKNFNQ